MNRTRDELSIAPVVTEDTDSDITSTLKFEGIHKGVIMTDRWGNEWDDTGELGDIDFRLVDGDD